MNPVDSRHPQFIRSHTHEEPDCIHLDVFHQQVDCNWELGYVITGPQNET